MEGAQRQNVETGGARPASERLTGTPGTTKVDVVEGAVFSWLQTVISWPTPVGRSGTDGPGNGNGQYDCTGACKKSPNCCTSTGRCDAQPVPSSISHSDRPLSTVPVPPTRKIDVDLSSREPHVGGSSGDSVGLCMLASLLDGYRRVDAIVETRLVRPGARLEDYMAYVPLDDAHTTRRPRVGVSNNLLSLRQDGRQWYRRHTLPWSSDELARDDAVEATDSDIDDDDIYYRESVSVDAILEPEQNDLCWRERGVPTVYTGGPRVDIFTGEEKARAGWNGFDAWVTSDAAFLLGGLRAPEFRQVSLVRRDSGIWLSVGRMDRIVKKISDLWTFDTSNARPEEIAAMTRAAHTIVESLSGLEAHGLARLVLPGDSISGVGDIVVDTPIPALDGIPEPRGLKRVVCPTRGWWSGLNCWGENLYCGATVKSVYAPAEWIDCEYKLMEGMQSISYLRDHSYYDGAVSAWTVLRVVDRAGWYLIREMDLRRQDFSGVLIREDMCREIGTFLGIAGETEDVRLIRDLNGVEPDCVSKLTDAGEPGTYPTVESVHYETVMQDTLNDEAKLKSALRSGIDNRISGRDLLACYTASPYRLPKFRGTGC